MEKLKIAAMFGSACIIGSYITVKIFEQLNYKKPVELPALEYKKRNSNIIIIYDPKTDPVESEEEPGRYTNEETQKIIKFLETNKHIVQSLDTNSTLTKSQNLMNESEGSTSNLKQT